MCSKLRRAKVKTLYRCLHNPDQTRSRQYKSDARPSSTCFLVFQTSRTTTVGLVRWDMPPKRSSAQKTFRKLQSSLDVHHGRQMYKKNNAQDFVTAVLTEPAELAFVLYASLYSEAQGRERE